MNCWYKIIDDKKVKYFGAKITAQEMQDLGYTFGEYEEPVVAIDTTAFDLACSQFKAICSQIGNLIGETSFKGGFDEMQVFQSSEQSNTIEGLKLAMAWSAANEYAKYEGSKLGLGQPAWWYKCWEE